MPPVPAYVADDRLAAELSLSLAVCLLVSVDSGLRHHLSAVFICCTSVLLCQFKLTIGFCKDATGRGHSALTIR